jgi:hypothetical protein
MKKSGGVTPGRIIILSSSTAGICSAASAMESVITLSRSSSVIFRFTFFSFNSFFFFSFFTLTLLSVTFDSLFTTTAGVSSAAVVIESLIALLSLLPFLDNSPLYLTLNFPVTYS